MITTELQDAKQEKIAAAKRAERDVIEAAQRAVHEERARLEREKTARQDEIKAAAKQVGLSAMKLDAATEPIGTKGFLPPGTSFEFSSPDDDFEWFKYPAVVLNDDRKWELIGAGSAEYSIIAGCAASVYRDWQSAVRHTIDSEREEAYEMLRDAYALLTQVSKVEKWLNNQGDKQP